MEEAARRVLSAVAASLSQPADYFEPYLARHCSNLQVANYPSQHVRLFANGDMPLRVKAHADSGTVTLLLRQSASEGALSGSRCVQLICV